LRETLASTRATLNNISKTQSTIKDALEASKSLENRWTKFQNDFERILGKAVDNIARGLGVPPAQGSGGFGAAYAGDGDMKTLEKFKVLGFDCTMRSVARRMRSGKYKNVVVLMGAGCSVSAGIPDFRTPGTGLYSQVQKYNLPYAEAIFDLHYFNNVDREPFHTIAKEMYPDPAKFKPTKAHKFVKLLHDKGILLKCYTQNIDGLELLAGLPPSAVVEAHGSFTGPGRCSHCSAPCDESELKEALTSGASDEGGGSGLKCRHCGPGYCKPPIVFFGEDLPPAFTRSYKADMEGCDLCIVMGTSLSVAPFSGLPGLVPDDVPRMLFNREAVGDFRGVDDDEDDEGDERRNYRDVVALGDCDDRCCEMAELLGWHHELAGSSPTMASSGHSSPPPPGGVEGPVGASKVRRVASSIKAGRLSAGRGGKTHKDTRRVSVDESRNRVKTVPRVRGPEAS